MRYLGSSNLETRIGKWWNFSFFHFFKNGHQGCFAKKQQKVLLFYTFSVFFVILGVQDPYQQRENKFSKKQKTAFAEDSGHQNQ